MRHRSGFFAVLRYAKTNEDMELLPEQGGFDSYAKSWGEFDP